MNLTYDYFSSVITVERASLPIVSTDPYEVREFDVEEMHSILRAAEASEIGIVYKDTHNWSAAKFIGGVDLAPVHEMINGYTVTFEPGIYAVKLKGANNNVVDVMNINTVSTQTANSAGLIKVNTGGGGGGDGVDHTDQLNSIEGKIDTGLANQATIEGKIDAIDTELDGLDVNVDLTPISNQLDVIEGKVDGVVTVTNSIETKVDGIVITLTGISGNVDDIPAAVWAYTGPQ